MWVALGWLFGGWAAASGWWWLMGKASRRAGVLPDKIKGAVAVVWLLVALTGSAAAQGAVPLAGPVAAEVVRVIDGDTVEVRARAWIDTEVTTRVRLLGVDTPEKGSRARCQAEAAMAERASAATRAALPEGAAALLAAGLARPYDGGRKAGWCE